MNSLASCSLLPTWHLRRNSGEPPFDMALVDLAGPQGRRRKGRMVRRIGDILRLDGECPRTLQRPRLSDDLGVPVDRRIKLHAALTRPDIEAAPGFRVAQQKCRLQFAARTIKHDATVIVPGDGAGPPEIKARARLYLVINAQKNVLQIVI